MPIKAQMKEVDNSRGKAMKDYATRTATPPEDKKTPAPKRNQVKAHMKEVDGSRGKAMKDYVNRTSTKKEAPAAPASKPQVKGSVKDAPTRQNPKKYGESNEKLRTTSKGIDKANVPAAQLQKSCMSLRQYMNAWNKTGSRPTGKK